MRPEKHRKRWRPSKVSTALVAWTVGCFAAAIVLSNETRGSNSGLESGFIIFAAWFFGFLVLAVIRARTSKGPRHRMEEWEAERLETLDREVEEDRKRRAERREQVMKGEWSDD